MRATKIQNSYKITIATSKFVSSRIFVLSQVQAFYTS